MWVCDKPIVDICHQINEISFELQMETILMLVSVLHNDQLPAGLIAQLVEQCTSIAEVRFRVSFRPLFCY